MLPEKLGRNCFTMLYCDTQEHRFCRIPPGEGKRWRNDRNAPWSPNGLTMFEFCNGQRAIPWPGVKSDRDQTHKHGWDGYGWSFCCLNCTGSVFFWNTVQMPVWIGTSYNIFRFKNLRSRYRKLHFFKIDIYIYIYIYIHTHTYIYIF